MKLTTLIFLLLAASCAHQEKIIEPTPGLSEESQVTAKTDGSYYTIIEFEKGTANLTPKSEEELKAFLSKTKAEGSESKEIKILTWPDVKKAEAKDEKIADMRARSIMNYMKKKLKAREDLLPFNMTNRTSILSSFLESDDPKRKKVFEKTGVITEEGEDLAALKENQEGKALILREYE